jgi:hypothetical protein
MKLLLTLLLLAPVALGQIVSPTVSGSTNPSRFVIQIDGAAGAVLTVPSIDGYHERKYVNPADSREVVRCYFSRTLSPSGTYTVMVGIEADIPPFKDVPRVFFQSSSIVLSYPGSGGVTGWQAVSDKKTNLGLNRSIYCTEMRAPYAVSTLTNEYRNVNTDGGVGFTQLQFSAIDLLGHIPSVVSSDIRTEVFFQEVKTTLCLNAQPPAMVYQPSTGLPMPVTLHADGKSAFGEVWFFTKSPGWLIAGSLIPLGSGFIGEVVSPIVTIQTNDTWAWNPIKVPLETLLARNAAVQFVGFNEFGQTLPIMFPVGQAWQFNNTPN